MISIRSFDKEKDLDSIDSFLQSRQESHNLSYKDSEEWFKWKFLNSPKGPAIMPTAFKENKIVGANYYGIYPLIKNKNVISAILPYEAFVHQSAQGKGLFKKLIKSAEETALERNVEIMLSFPNKNSVRGFISSGWEYVPNHITYWIKPSFKLRFLANILDLKKSIKPNKPNGKNNFDFGKVKNGLYKDQIHGLWSKEYLDWRFNIMPQAEYFHLKQDSLELIARIGFRGKLKETHILFIDFKTDKFDKKEFKQAIKRLKKQTNYDFISFPNSSHHPIHDKMKSLGFFKVPSGGQFCYKVLDESLKSKNLKFSLCGIDAHTY